VNLTHGDHDQARITIRRRALGLNPK